MPTFSVGIESDSFKIKFKKWSKNAKKISERYFRHEYMYILVRNDLSTAQKVVQSGHAIIESTRNYLTKDSTHPSVIICVVKSEDKLKKCAQELESKDISFKHFQEPDRNNEWTALASRPIFGTEREAFKRFQLMRD